jgi:gluconate 2-dehydrogenase subunit 3-like protein
MDTRPSLQNQAFTALSVAEASALDALFKQLFPADENGPGASSIGVIEYLDRALSGPYAHYLEIYRLGIYALDVESESRFGKPFVDADGSQQRDLIGALEQNSAPNFRVIQAKAFFELSRVRTGPFPYPKRLPSR